MPAVIKRYFDQLGPVALETTTEEEGWPDLEAGVSEVWQFSRHDTSPRLMEPYGEPNITNLYPCRLGTVFTNGWPGKWSPKQPTALLMTGWIDAPEDGEYRFAVLADDGAFLNIDGTNVVSGYWWGAVYAGTNTMSKGLHRVSVGFWDGGDAYALSFRWKTPSGE